MTLKKTPTETDWARMAAFIDGEGCISLVEHRTVYTCLRIMVTNTDRRLVEWCKSLFDGHICEKKARKPTHKPSYQWVVSSRAAAFVIKGCYPYFLLKKEQSEVALEFLTTINPSISNFPILRTEQKKKRKLLLLEMHQLNKKGPRVA